MQADRTDVLDLHDVEIELDLENLEQLEDDCDRRSNVDLEVEGVQNVDFHLDDLLSLVDAFGLVAAPVKRKALLIKVLLEVFVELVVDVIRLVIHLEIIKCWVN